MACVLVTLNNDDDDDDECSVFITFRSGTDNRLYTVICSQR
jgi:hypothetical protein